MCDALELVVVDVSGGYAIEVKNGEVNNEKYSKFFDRVYKHKHVAVSRKNKIEEEVKAEQQ